MVATPTCYLCNGVTIAWPSYDIPPVGETLFSNSYDFYPRAYGFCAFCIHWTSSLIYHPPIDYSSQYAHDAHGFPIKEKFDAIIQLAPNQSDNKARVAWLNSKLLSKTKNGQGYQVLDVGSGLGVFPFEMAKHGWKVLAVEPSIQFCEHLRKVGGFEVYHGEFNPAVIDRKFSIITLNKVLEHVSDPLELLLKLKKCLDDNGVIYIEVPDGPAAMRSSSTREEFYLEHLHVFSRDSINQTLRNAGFEIPDSEEVCEPSGKLTLRSLANLPVGA